MCVKQNKLCNAFLCNIHSYRAMKMLNAHGMKKREMGMSRQVMCINNLKKLGDVVRISV